ncbi:MAG: baseplate J/gp47 family protein [Bacilli bacterium]|nr:baseplate J/gp47 family protein [Bacilli bacterium]
MPRTFTEILESMNNFIKGKYPYLDTSEGTIIYDINLLAPSQEFAKQYIEIHQVSQNQSVLTASESGLISLGSNVAIQRKNARHSKGRITFFRFTAPTQDITVPVGTIVAVDPTGGDDIQFITTSPITMYLTLASVYLNTSTNLYEISTDIEAIVGGTQGNVGSEVINTIITPISGFNGCYNLNPTSGGADIESKESLRNRIAVKTRGNSISTTDGILSEVLSHPDVEDAIVVGNGESERNDFGAIDIYIKGKVSKSYKESYIVTGAENEKIILSKQPVIPKGVSSVVSSASGALPVHIFNKDFSALGGSVRGSDYISFNPPLDTSYGSLLITYSYNSVITDLQNIFNTSNKHIQNADILVFWATEVVINVASSLKILPGFDYDSVIGDIEENLAVFFSNLSIGEQIQQADVAKVILDTPGVDDLLLPFTTFESDDGTITRDSFGNLNLPSKGYAILGSVTLNLVT